MHIDIELELDHECWVCKGTGIPTERNTAYKRDDGSCDACEGIGHQLTEQGKMVLAFLGRHKHRL